MGWPTTPGGNGPAYTLPVATPTVLGGVKVGNNLTSRPDGTLDSNAVGISPNSPAAGANVNVMSVIERIAITRDRTSGFPPRVVLAEGNRKSVIIRNPIDSPASIELGRTVADNIQNPNSNFAVPYVILPGQEAVFTYEGAQIFARQAASTVTANVFIDIERESQV